MRSPNILFGQSSIRSTIKRHRYINVTKKFWFGHIAAFLWLLFSIFLSIPWVNDLGVIVGKPFAIFIIAGIGYIPGYINMFIVISLLLDRQPQFKTTNPNDPVTIIIACHNEEKSIANTLRYVKNQDYQGLIRIIVVDNASIDKTAEAAHNAGENLRLNMQILYEEKPGKYNALNKALKYVHTQYVVTLDADTLLHKSAIRYLVS